MGKYSMKVKKWYNTMALAKKKFVLDDYMKTVI